MYINSTIFLHMSHLHCALNIVNELTSVSAISTPPSLTQVVKGGNIAPASRGTIMVALQNVQKLLIRCVQIRLKQDSKYFCICTLKCIFLCQRLREYRFMFPFVRRGVFTQPLIDSFELQSIIL